MTHHATDCQSYSNPERDCTCSHYRRSSSGSGEFGPTEPPVKYDTTHTTYMKNLNKLAPQIKHDPYISNDKPAANMPPPMLGAATPLAAIIEVEPQGGCKATPKTGSPTEPTEYSEEINKGYNYLSGTVVAFQRIFNVSGHNYLFTSKCCTNCIKVKHKKMLRAYLIDHGAKPKSLSLWWKVWRATK